MRVSCKYVNAVMLYIYLKHDFSREFQDLVDHEEPKELQGSQ